MREAFGVPGVRCGGRELTGKRRTVQAGRAPHTSHALCLTTGDTSAATGRDSPSGWQGLNGREVVVLGDARRRIPGPLRPRGAGTAWGCRGAERRDGRESWEKGCHGCLREEIGCQRKGSGMKTKRLPPSALGINIRDDSDGNPGGAVLPSGNHCARPAVTRRRCHCTRG